VYKKYLRLLFLLVGVVTFFSTFRLAIVASNADTLITNVAIADEENAFVFHTWDEREKHLLGMGVSPALVGALHAYDTNLREAIDRGASEQELIRITDEFNKLAAYISENGTNSLAFSIDNGGKDVTILDERDALVFHTWDEREKHLLGMGVSPALVGALHAYDTNLREAIDRGASEQELIRITDEFNELSIQLANDSISNGNGSE
jgi:alkylhydroperoxidase/carboxymuconolactone decarboxylase family protein YurZ